jgi:hypothetical protein
LPACVGEPLRRRSRPRRAARRLPRRGSPPRSQAGGKRSRGEASPSCSHVQRGVLPGWRFARREFFVTIATWAAFAECEVVFVVLGAPRNARAAPCPKPRLRWTLDEVAAATEGDPGTGSRAPEARAKYGGR